MPPRRQIALASERVMDRRSHSIIWVHSYRPPHQAIKLPSPFPSSTPVRLSTGRASSRDRSATATAPSGWFVPRPPRAPLFPSATLFWRPARLSRPTVLCRSPETHVGRELPKSGRDLCRVQQLHRASSRPGQLAGDLSGQRAFAPAVGGPVTLTTDLPLTFDPNSVLTGTDNFVADGMLTLGPNSQLSVAGSVSGDGGLALSDGTVTIRGTTTKQLQRGHLGPWPLGRCIS